MTCIVINTDYGGFGLSKEAFRAWLTAKNIEYWPHPESDAIVFLSKPTGDPFLDDRREIMAVYDVARDDPDLVKIVLTLGPAANGPSARLKVVTIPDDVEWVIEVYDGKEWVAEKHRTWE